MLALPIYLAYPDCDLLPIRPPGPNETCSNYKAYLERFQHELGDTLFLFIFRELSDAEVDGSNGMRATDRAISDLQAVRLAVLDSDKCVDNVSVRCAVACTNAGAVRTSSTATPSAARRTTK